MGDSQALESIIVEFRPLINKIINLYNCEYGDYQIDYDELNQIASIALFEGCEKYNIEKGMSISSFLYMVLQARIITYFKTCSKLYNHEYYSLNVDRCITRYADRISDSSYEYYKEKEFESIINNFIDKQNNEDKQILLLRKLDIPCKEIAKKLNTNCKKINNRLYILKKKFKQELNDEYDKMNS